MERLSFSLRVQKDHLIRFGLCGLNMLNQGLIEIVSGICLFYLFYIQQPTLDYIFFYLPFPIATVKALPCSKVKKYI